MQSKQATPTAIVAPSGCKRFEASTHQLKSMIPVATATGIPMNLRISVGFIFFLLQGQTMTLISLLNAPLSTP